MLTSRVDRRSPSASPDTYQGHLDLGPRDVGHGGRRLQQRRGEEEVVVAGGRQVQRHGDVEGQREDREVPLAEEGAQGTGEDGAVAEAQETVDEAPALPGRAGGLSPGRAACGLRSLSLTGPEHSFPRPPPWAWCAERGDAQAQLQKEGVLGLSGARPKARSHRSSF